MDGVRAYAGVLNLLTRLWLRILVWSALGCIGLVDFFAWGGVSSGNFSVAPLNFLPMLRVLLCDDQMVFLLVLKFFACLEEVFRYPCGCIHWRFSGDADVLRVQLVLAGDTEPAGGR